MAELGDIVGYLCKCYPHKHDLSKARVTKMVYLADWRMAIMYGRQVSPIRWKFNQYGPYVDDVVNLANDDNRFQVIQEETVYGSPKQVIQLRGSFEPGSLSPEERAALDHVIDRTSKLSYAAFVRLVYSTFPVLVSERHTELDLVGLAKRYQREEFAS